MREFIFDSIRIKNFRNIQDETSLDFTPNRLVLIVGPNGAGKTTIAVDALCWVLYGATSKGLRGDSVINKRIGKNTEVHVNWRLNEDLYEVSAYRKHDVHHNKRILKKNGVKISGGEDTGDLSNETLKKISECLMPKEVFLNCLLFSKFLKESFIKMGPSAKQDIIDQVLLLNMWNERYEKAKKYIKLHENTIISQKSIIPTNESNIKSNQEIINLDKRSIITAKARFDENEQARAKEIESLITNIHNLKQQLVNYDSVKAEVERLNEVKISGQNELTQMNNQYRAEIEQLKLTLENEHQLRCAAIQEKYSSSKRQLNESISELNQQLANLNSKRSETLRAIENQAQSARQKASDNRASTLRPIEDEYNSVTSKLVSLDKELNTLFNSNSILVLEIQSEEDDLKKERPKCNSCGQLIQDNESLQKLQAKLQQKKDRNHKERLRLDEIQKEIRALVSREKELGETKTAHINSFNQADEIREQKILNTISKANTDFDNQCSSISQSIPPLREQLGGVDIQISNEINESNKLKDQELKNRSENIKDKYQKLAKDIYAKTKTATEEYQKIESTFNQLNEFKLNLEGQSSRLQSKQQEAVQAKIEYERNIADTESKIKHIEDVNTSLQNNIIRINNDLSIVQRKIDIANFWKEGFSDKGIKSLLLDEAMPILNNKARELSNLIDKIQVRFDNQPITASGETRNKFMVDALNTVDLSELKEFSSGEECMTNIVVLLCLRHLLEEMQDCSFNILLLDEMLDSLDPTNASVAVDMVRQLSGQYCVILISHTLREQIEADETLNLTH